jgi:hypothetical protein
MKICKTAGIMDAVKQRLPFTGRSPIMTPDQIQKLTVKRMELIQQGYSGQISPQQYRQEIAKLDAIFARHNAAANLKAEHAGDQIRDVQQKADDRMPHMPGDYGQNEMSDEEADRMIANHRVAGSTPAVVTVEQPVVRQAAQTKTTQGEMA